MKFTFLLTALTFTISGTAWAYTPVEEVIKNGEEIANRMEIAEIVVNKSVLLVEKAAKNNGANTKLKTNEIGKLTINLMRANEVLSPAISFYIQGINHALLSTSRHSPESDRFQSMKALAGGLSRSIMNAIEAAGAGDSAAQVQGELKSIRFTILDTVGHLLVAISDIAENNKLQNSELIVFKSIYSHLRKTYARAYKSLLNEKAGTVGDRTVAYVYGTTMAFARNEGPSALRADDALVVEKSVAQELAAKINETESQNKKLGRYTKLKAKKSNCADLLSTAPDIDAEEEELP